MAKRFTSTDIWTEDWFLDMPMEYKMFWYYMLANCDHAGLYKVNLRSFCGLNEVKLTSKTALTYFNTGKQRIREISERVWLIEEYYIYQYGHILNINNKVHKSILQLYIKHDIDLTSIRGLREVKQGVKDIDIDNILNKVTENFSKNNPDSSNAKTKKTEDMIVLEMMKVWKATNPEYVYHKNTDYSACLKIAYLIAEFEEIDRSEIVKRFETANLKEIVIMQKWEEIVTYVSQSDFYKTFSIDGIAVEKNMQKIYNAIKRGKTNPQLNGKALTPYEQEMADRRKNFKSIQD